MGRNHQVTCMHDTESNRALTTELQKLSKVKGETLKL